MKKSNKIVFIIIIMLAVVVGITSYLNRGNMAKNNELNGSATFIIKENDIEIARYNMKEIQDIGEKNFRANLKTNGKKPINYEYTGVLLKDVFEKAGVEVDGKEAVIVEASDGYVVSIPIEKVLDDDNVYVAYKREAELLGTREEGGKGPYQVIISKDQFSQYWCKYALYAEVKGE